MLIGTIGIGLFFLIIVWILALLIFIFGIKFQNNLSWVSLGIATSLTIILLFIPIDKLEQSIKKSDNLGNDYTFVYQILIFLFLFLNALFAFFFFLILHCIEPIRVQPIKQFNF